MALMINWSSRHSGARATRSSNAGGRCRTAPARPDAPAPPLRAAAASERNSSNRCSTIDSACGMCSDVAANRQAPFDDAIERAVGEAARFARHPQARNRCSRRDRVGVSRSAAASGGVTAARSRRARWATSAGSRRPLLAHPFDDRGFLVGIVVARGACQTNGSASAKPQLRSATCRRSGQRVTVAELTPAPSRRGRSRLRRSPGQRQGRASIPRGWHISCLASTSRLDTHDERRQRRLRCDVAVRRPDQCTPCTAAVGSSSSTSARSDRLPARSRRTIPITTSPFASAACNRRWRRAQSAPTCRADFADMRLRPAGGRRPRRAESAGIPREPRRAGARSRTWRFTPAGGTSADPTSPSRDMIEHGEFFYRRANDAVREAEPLGRASSRRHGREQLTASISPASTCPLPIRRPREGVPLSRRRAHSPDDGSRGGGRS